MSVDATERHGKPVPREEEHYKLLFSNSPAKFRDGFTAPLDSRTTLEMMYDRDSGEKSGVS